MKKKMKEADKSWLLYATRLQRIRLLVVKIMLSVFVVMG